MGSSFDKDARKFEFNQILLAEYTRNKKAGESTNQKMAKICGRLAESVVSFEHESSRFFGNISLMYEIPYAFVY